MPASEPPKKSRLVICPFSSGRNTGWSPQSSCTQRRPTMPVTSGTEVRRKRSGKSGMSRLRRTKRGWGSPRTPSAASRPARPARTSRFSQTDGAAVAPGEPEAVPAQLRRVRRGVDAGEAALRRGQGHGLVRTGELPVYQQLAGVVRLVPQGKGYRCAALGRAEGCFAGAVLRIKTGIIDRVPLTSKGCSRRWRRHRPCG